MTLPPHTYPPARSLAHRVCEGFRRKLLGTESITTGQVAEKFGTQPRDVAAFLSSAVHHAWLDRTSIGPLQHAYSPGRALRELMKADAAERAKPYVPAPTLGQRFEAAPAPTPAVQTPAPAPQAEAKPAKKPKAPKPRAERRRTRRPLAPPITPEQLLVRTGMPPPRRGGRTHVTDYSPILAPLTAADVSVDFPIEHLIGVRYAARLRMQATPGLRFAIGVAHDDATKGRITRLA